jgi:hypothetical protein
MRVSYDTFSEPGFYRVIRRNAFEKNMTDDGRIILLGADSQEELDAEKETFVCADVRTFEVIG